MANTLFVFIDTALPFETAASMVVNEQNHIIEDYKVRSLETLQTLSESYTLTLVLPCHVVNAQVISLPTLKNADLMLPNILEESLCEPIENIHFVLNKTPLSKTRYVCHYINKNFLNELLDTLTTLKLDPSVITCELLSHQTKSLFIANDFIQIISEEFMGSLSPKGLAQVSDLNLAEFQAHTFTDQEPTWLAPLNIVNCQTSPLTYQAYIACQHQKHSPINLLQGPYAKKQTNSNAIKLLGWPLLSLCVGFFILSHVLEYRTLENSVEKLKKQNLAYYQAIFPQAKQMISPRFRVEQWLKQHQTEQTPAILAILQAIAPKLNLSNSIKILSLQGDNRQLTLIFQIANFDELNTLKKHIEESGISIEQVNALSENNVINTIWKLSQ